MILQYVIFLFNIRSTKASMTTDNKQRIAIVGAGPAGLVAARWAIHYNLQPTLYDSAPTVGGVWRLESRGSNGETPSFRWPSNRTKLSRYCVKFHGLPHTVQTEIFPTREQMGTYLERYAAHFGILPFTRLKHRVISAEPIDEDIKFTRWQISFINESNEKLCEQFDRLIIATGDCAKKFIPKAFQELLTDKNCSFEGQVYHTPIDAPNELSAYSGKNVVIVGNSFSALELLAFIAGNEDAEANAKHVTLLRRRPYWIVPKFVPINPLKNAPPEDQLDSQLPFDVLFMRRCVQQENIYQQEDESLTFHHMLESLLPNHNLMAGGKFALNPRHRSVCFTLVGEGFTKNVERIGERLDVFEKDPVVALEEKSILLASGASVPCDMLVFGTGFESSAHEILSSRVLEALEFNSGKCHQKLLLHKMTLHPQLHTISFVGVNEGLLFMHMEMQARWTAAVFAGRQPPPDPSDPQVQQYLSQRRSERDFSNDSRPTLMRGDFVAFADELAQEVGVKPDFARIQEEDPELYSLLWNAPVIGAHYFLEGPDANREAAMSEIKSLPKEFHSFPLNK